MALVAAGLVNVSGDLIDTVRSTTCAKEASAIAGGSVSDGGSSRYYTETRCARASGYRINMGALALGAAFTVVVRMEVMDQVAENGALIDDYHSLVSQGGVFENATRCAVGWRNSTFVGTFAYQRDGATLRGVENGGTTIAAGQLITVIHRVAANNKQSYYCQQDIGGAGVDYVLATTSADGIGTAGGQNLYLGGPNTFTSTDASGRFRIIGALVYDHRIDDTELAAIALDGATGFYAQLVAGPSITTQPTAQTAVINNSTSPGPTATFTVAATTSGGALSYQWQVEDSVGAGTYSNISNGGIYAGATSTSLMVTPTTKTGLTGLRVRCNVTDSNGTTTTNAVALTVYTGFQFTSSTTGSTNPSGVLTVTWTDDRAGSVLGNGGFVKGTATTSTSTSLTSQRPT